MDTYKQEDSGEGVMPVEEGSGVNRGKRRGSWKRMVLRLKH